MISGMRVEINYTVIRQLKKHWSEYLYFLPIWHRFEGILIIIIWSKFIALINDNDKKFILLKTYIQNCMYKDSSVIDYVSTTCYMHFLLNSSFIFLL